MSDTDKAHRDGERPALQSLRKWLLPAALAAFAIYSGVQWSRAVVARDEAVVRATQWAEVARGEAAAAMKSQDAWVYVDSLVERITNNRLEALKEPSPPISLISYDQRVMRILFEDIVHKVGRDFVPAALKIASLARALGDKTEEAQMIDLSSVSIKKLIGSGADSDALRSAQQVTTFAPDDLGGVLASAHVLMFHNQSEAAVALHKQHAGKLLPNGKSWDEVAQKDFADFARCGRQHPDIATIQKLLKPSTDVTTGPCPL